MLKMFFQGVNYPTPMKNCDDSNSKNKDKNSDGNSYSCSDSS